MWGSAGSKVLFISVTKKDALGEQEYPRKKY